MLEGGQLYHLHTDHIDRPVMATDSAGATVWQASYTPFGGIHQVSVNTGALTAQDLRFPGQWFQAETGLHQNWHRDYDPTTGRYLQADPLGLVDGPSVYGYVSQNPTKYSDPTGLFQGCAFGPQVCAVSATINLIGAGIAYFTRPDFPGGVPNPDDSANDNNCPDDRCKKKQEIPSWLMKEIKRDRQWTGRTCIYQCPNGTIRALELNRDYYDCDQHLRPFEGRQISRAGEYGPYLKF